MKTEPVYTEKTKEGYTIEIYKDPDPMMNPRRDWDPLGRMVCWHSRYDLGDAPHGKRPAHEETPEAFHEWMKADPDARGALVLPLYLYEHSGITIRAASSPAGGNPFSCPWDSGAVGYIYMTRADIWKEYGKGPHNRRKALACLRASVKEYAAYLEGEVYGFAVYAPAEDAEDEDARGEELDSCWGFIETDWSMNKWYCVQEARSVAAHYAKEAKTREQVAYQSA